MLNTRVCAAAVLLFGSCAAAADRPDMTGTWELDPARSRTEQLKSGKLVITQTPDAIEIHEELTPASGKPDAFNFRCETLGKPCALRDDGEPVEVSIWHNGSKLVILETRGKKKDSVTKKLLDLAAGGQSLTMEVRPILPANGKNETLVFAKR